jgi:hypothetical protein
MTPETEAPHSLAVNAGSVPHGPETCAALAQTLEQCGYLKREVHAPLVNLASDLESRIARAKTAFCTDGSDGKTAANMFRILFSPNTGSQTQPVQKL